MRRVTALLICGLMLLSACSQAEEQPSGTTGGGISLFTEDPSPSDLPETSEDAFGVSAETAPPQTVPEISDAVIEPQTFAQTEAVILIEPEEQGNLPESASVTDSREGYSGSGCVSGLRPEDTLVAEADLPASQHYNITLRAAADSPVSGTFAINGIPCGSFSLSGEGFEALRFDNIFLSAGKCLLGITALSGAADIDCLLIENSGYVPDFSLPGGGTLCTPNPSAGAEALYGYITGLFGKKILSGQQVSQGSDAELEAVYGASGRYPAIRFGELMDYSAGADSGDIELAIDWAKSGGIVGYVWNWTMNGSVYADRTGFDLSKAVTDLDIVAMNGSALTLRYESGDITVETLAVIDGIDLAAEALKRLKDENIPVLFRPLPEASGGQFWWSQSADSYKWLYKLIYERMTVYHGLDNLIWVWNGQSPEWYVGDNMCDIVSLDVYLDGDTAPYPSCLNFLLAAREITPSKPVALSEISQLPSPDSLALDSAVWSYISTWTGEYSPEGTGTDPSIWDRFYNNTMVITKDKIEYNR